MGLRAFCYQRVSDDRSQGRSVAEQERENDRVIERRGWEKVASFTDNDRGASRYSARARPRWNEMLERLARGEADVLVTWEASRSTRDLDVYVALRKVCRQHSVLWSFNGTDFDLSDGDDSFRTGLEILLAEKEVEQTRKRVLRSTQANAEAGRPHGKLLTGYLRVYNGNGAFVRSVKDPAWAPIVEEIFHRKLAGELDQWIVNDLQRRGLKTLRGADWSPSQVKRMLMNPGYAGLRIHRGVVLGSAEWAEQAYITEAEHHQIMAGYEAQRTGRRHDAAVKHLLSGIATCGVCGGRCFVLKPRGRISYVCREHHCVARSKPKLDALITELIIARLSRPDILSLLAPDNEAALAAIDEISVLQQRLQEFCDQAVDGSLSPQALARIENSLLAKIEALEVTARRVNLPGAVHQVAANPASTWATLGIMQQREIIRTLMRVQVNRSRKGERSLDPDTITVTWRHEAGGE